MAEAQGFQLIPPEPSVPQIVSENVLNKHGFYVTQSINPQTGEAFYPFFAPYLPCEIISASIEYNAVSTTTAGIQLLRFDDGESYTSGGDNILVSDWDITTGTGAANTIHLKSKENGDLVKDYTVLKRGHRLGWDSTGAISSGVLRLQITIYIKPLGKGHFKA